MAQIVGAFASSHGPLLSTPPDMWYQRAEADRMNKSHWFRGKTYDFDGLVEARKPGFADQSTGFVEAINGSIDEPEVVNICTIRLGE